MKAKRLTFVKKVRGDELLATEVEEIRSVTDNHADLLDTLATQATTASQMLTLDDAQAILRSAPLTPDLVPGWLYLLAGPWDAGDAAQVVAVPAIGHRAFAANGTLVATPVRVDVAAGTTSALGAPDLSEIEAELDQHSLQLATLGVQGSPVYGYLKSGGAPVGYVTLDDALADARAKTFMRFNVATVRAEQSNDPTGKGWPFYLDGSGVLFEVGEDVTLSVPGVSIDSLQMRNFFIYHADGARRGKVKLLASNNAPTPLGQLPSLSGQCTIPLELSGGAVALSGAYNSLIGTGTVYAIEPFYAGFVASGVTIMKVGGAAMTPATTTTLGGLLVGPGLQVDSAGKVSLKIDTSTLGQRADGTLYVPTTSGNISPAATPTNLTAVLTNGGYTCTLNWDPKPGATLYQVYRSVNGGPWALVVGVPYNYFVDSSGVTANTFTLYRITAANSTGESAPSVVAQAQ